MVDLFYAYFIKININPNSQKKFGYEGKESCRIDHKGKHNVND
jgi:hypothetical protein